MPVSYEPLNVNTDVTTTKTILHEVIPLTGAVVSGTYNDENIKNFVHGMFQSVYDYPYLSSSANHVFDLSCGYDESSALSASVNAMNTKKINMYNQFSQVLLGYTGSNNVVRLFENDLTLDSIICTFDNKRSNQERDVFNYTWSRKSEPCRRRFSGNIIASRIS